MTHEHEARIHDAARRRANELREQALDRAWQRIARWLAWPRAPRRPLTRVEA
jgi:hypothetical protein